MKKGYFIILSLFVLAIPVTWVSATDFNSGNIPIVHSTVKEGFTVILEGQGSILTPQGQSNIYSVEWALTTTNEGNHVLFVWNQQQNYTGNDLVWLFPVLAVVFIVVGIFFLLLGRE